MDKRIVDLLTKFGFITNVGIDADKYESVDELIAKGVITIPGSKSKIDELLANVVKSGITNEEPVTETTVVNEVLEDNATVIDETPVTDAPLVDTPEDVTPINEVPDEEVETIVCDNPAEVEVSIVEEIETHKKSKKTKKTE